MCSVFFLYLLFFKLYRSGNNKSLFSATTFTLVTGIFCFCCCYVFFCIRQHDVNILRTEKLEKRRDVCVLRFFSFLSSSFSQTQKELLRVNQHQTIKSDFSIFSFVFCVGYVFCFICIRQHDVNILMQKF